MSSTTVAKPAASIVAVGRLADRLHVSLPAIKSQMQRLSIGPAMIINGTEFVNADDADRIAQSIASKEASKT